MSISLDYRTGSKELEPLFKDFGIQVQLKKLEFGDLAFEGNGPNGRCAVVIERKTVTDLIASIQSKRLSGHQMPGMADTYDYCYLIVEGMWRPGPQGEMQIGYGTFDGPSSFGGRWGGVHGRTLPYRAADNYLATLELHAGAIYRRTLNPTETVAVVVDLYRWWNDKLWAEHSSHLGVYAPAEPKRGKGRRLNLFRRDISLAEKWAMQLDRIDSRAQVVAEYFGSAFALATATETQWVMKGIGKPTAKQIVEAIRADI